MITNNLSTLKIHKLSKAQYERELTAGRIDENALYLTPDEEAGLAEGTLVYKGEITDIPANATKGDVYKLTQDIGNVTNISIVENGNLLTNLVANCELVEDSGEGCFYLSLFSSTDYEIPEDIKTLVFNILGTTEFTPNDGEGVEVPNKNIGIILDGITYNLKTEWCQWIEYVDEGVYARNLAIGGVCSELDSNEYLQIVGYNDDDEFAINYQNVSINIGDIDYRANSYILYNGEKWVEFVGPVEELLNSYIKSLEGKMAEIITRFDRLQDYVNEKLYDIETQLAEI